MAGLDTTPGAQPPVDVPDRRDLGTKSVLGEHRLSRPITRRLPIAMLGFSSYMLMGIPLSLAGGPAAALRLRERGILREGYLADITVFSPGEIGEQATYDDPHQYARGIAAVVVNGTVVFDGGEHTGKLPGKLLRRGSDGMG